jgi:ribulose-bisphosphate carboxylase large chain
MSADRKTRMAKPPPMRRFKSNFRWTQTELEPYKVSAHTGGEFRGASRQVLIGKQGEQVNFHVRYFELEAGGFTSLERHHHSHVVIGANGRGKVRVGDKTYTLRPFDTIFIGPDQPHQLRASGAENFGFFCIVNARRDKPRLITSSGSAR